MFILFHLYLYVRLKRKIYYFTDIIIKLAQSSSESEIDPNFSMDVPLIEENFEVSFRANLQPFQDTVPRYMKNKKAHRQKKKVKKDSKSHFLIDTVELCLSEHMPEDKFRMFQVIEIY